MQTIRSFIAISLPPNVQAAVGRLIHRLATPDDGIKWVPDDNLHLTLKFLGDVDNVEIPRVCEALQAVCRDFAPFPLHLAGTGAFPHLDRPRVLWAGVDDPSETLRQLVAAIEARFADLGFKPEPRDYRPHLTLGRVRTRGRRPGPEVADRMRREQHVELGEMQADTVQLIASFLDKRGPSYQVMDTIELG